MANYFGIDFGTTNSAVVWYERGRTTARFLSIGDEDHHPYPSIIAIDNLTQQVTGGRTVKEKVIQLREGNAHLVVESVKTALDEDAFWPTPARTWNAEDIASKLFEALSARTERVVGELIRHAVVAIPVGMSSKQRAAIRRAARTAGIEVTNFISEPTAAFIAHAKELRPNRYVAVFDWGGGTLDISVLENRDGCILERHTDGSDKAGDYIDHRLAEWIHSRVAEQRGLDLAYENVDPRERQILLNQAEQCKCRLQDESATPQQIALGSYAGTTYVEQTVTPQELNNLIRPVIDEALDRLVRCIRDAGVSEEEIGKLIVVGGTSKLQSLQKELRRRWARPNIIFPEDAEWDIAKGAAWLAANPGEHRTAESIGVVLSDGEYHPIFPAGTQLEDSTFHLGFGLVEDSSTALFDFAAQNGKDSIPRHIGNLRVNSFGFRDEVIELETKINEDLVFEAIAHNPSLPGTSSSFKYQKLRWMYELPQGDL